MCTSNGLMCTSKYIKMHNKMIVVPLLTFSIICSTLSEKGYAYEDILTSEHKTWSATALAARQHAASKTHQQQPSEAEVPLRLPSRPP